MKKLIRGLTAFLFVLAVSVAAPAFAAGTADCSTAKAAPAVLQTTAPVQTGQLVLKTMQSRQVNDPAGTASTPSNGNPSQGLPWVMGTW